MSLQNYILRSGFTNILSVNFESEYAGICNYIILFFRKEVPVIFCCLSVKYVLKKILNDFVLWALFGNLRNPELPETVVTSSSKNYDCKQNFGIMVCAQCLATHLVFLLWWRKKLNTSPWVTAFYITLRRHQSPCQQSWKVLLIAAEVVNVSRPFDSWGFKEIFIKKWKQNMKLFIGIHS